MIRRHRVAWAAFIAATLLCLTPAGTPASGADAGDPAAIPGVPWTWPLIGARVEAPFEAPAHRYGPGHRGMDISGAGTGAVVAPADGVVAFSGMVAGRPLLTIDHGNGLVTTFEPVSPHAEAGRPVARGEQVGTLSTGGHTRLGALHMGVRLDGEYINPMLLFGTVPRAVLLPCCQAAAMSLRSPESVTSPSASASTSSSLPHRAPPPHARGWARRYAAASRSPETWV